MEPASLLVVAIIVISLIIAALRRFELTPLLVLGNLAIFFVTLFVNKWEVFGDLAFQPADLENGTGLYTLFTSMFIHYNFAHVIGNMLFLFFLGTPLESRIGKRRFALVYFSAGIVGSLFAAAYYFALGLNLDVYMLGASGAISGAVGTLLALYPRDEIPMFVGPIFLPRVPVWLAALSWFLLSVLLVFLTSSNVSWQAHLGGFMAGLAIGMLIGQGVEVERKREEAPRDYSRLEAMATTPQLRNALEHIRDERQKDVRKVWLEYFAEHATCPTCGGKMKYRNDRFLCQCGNEVEIWH
ncbi:MAG: rhomboid family intramembrane serine protease [Methanomassiliicoccus sp.]|nr:rhomboid family intramembrane serine protease [Methanomassiliicoccus sp.]